MSDTDKRDPKRFIWDKDDVVFERDANEKPLLTPEQREEARQRLAELEKSDKLDKDQ